MYFQHTFPYIEATVTWSVYKRSVHSYVLNAQRHLHIALVFVSLASRSAPVSCRSTGRRSYCLHQGNHALGQSDTTAHCNSFHGIE